MPFLDLNGARLRYEVAGQEPAIVLVHGGMCDLADWANQFRELARDHTAVTLDLRGHGESTGRVEDCTIERYAADVNALIDRLGLAPAVSVGHSMASRVVAEAAWRRPGNMAGIVLLDGSRSHGGFAATGPDTAPIPPPPPQALPDILDATIGPYASAIDRARIAATMSSAGPALMQALVETMREWDLGRADTVFGELPARLPLLAIQSTYHDRFTPRRSLTGEDKSTPYLDFLRGVRPELETVVLPRTGHFSMVEKPDEVSALIRNFSRKARESKA